MLAVHRLIRILHCDIGAVADVLVILANRRVVVHVHLRTAAVLRTLSLAIPLSFVALVSLVLHSRYSLWSASTL